MSRAILVLLVLFSHVAAYAQTYYVRSGAGGNGSSWANAYSTLPSTLVRGATYYVAAGSYGNYTFNTANSGETRITIKKATIAENSGDAGWSDAYAAQATFGSIYVLRGYLTIDGVTRDDDNWDSTGDYGFRVTGVIDSNTVNGASNPTNIILQYLDIGGPSGEYCTGSTPSTGVYVVYGSGQQYWVISRCHIHNVKIPVQTVGAQNLTIEYSLLAYSWSKEAISVQNAAGYIIKNNVFLNNLLYIATCGGIEPATADIWTRYTSGLNDDWEIYGNVFAEIDPPYTTYRTNAVIQGNNYSGGTASNWKIYNNTFYRLGGEWNSIVMLGTDNIVANNLWYGSRRSDQKIRITNSGTGSANYTQWCNSTPYSLCPTSPGTWISGSDNPFVDPENMDFRLKTSITGNSPVDAGTTLSGYDSTDRYGTVRGADGTWDIGAYEYSEGGPDPVITIPGGVTISGGTVK